MRRHFSEVFLDEVRIPADKCSGRCTAGGGARSRRSSNERGLIAGGNRRRRPVALIAPGRRSSVAATTRCCARPWSTAGPASEILRYLGFRAQTALSQGRAPGPETSVMKLFAAEYLRRLGDAALEVLGPDGMLDGGIPAWTWSRFLHAPSIRIAGGSNEIQRNIIGERVLGLPRDATTDRDVPFRDLARPRA